MGIWSNEQIEAVKHGNVLQLQQELSAGKLNVNGITDEFLPVIMIAVYYHQRDVVNWFQSNGCELDGYAAAALGDVITLTKWMNQQSKHDEALCSFSVDGWTLLHLAAFFGHDEVVTWLINHGAPLNLFSRNNQTNQPLHAAVAARHAQIAIDLICAGAPVNIEANGFTPLMLACANEMTELVEFLLEHGADPAYRSDAGITAWDMVERHEQDDIRVVLREYGAGVH